MSETELLAVLREAWCGAFNPMPGPRGDIHIATPFAFADGDVFPLILRSRSDSWVLTDGGRTASHLAFDDYEFTDGAEAQVRRLIATHGLDDRADLKLERSLQGLPTPSEIADFIQVVSFVAALPAVRAESRRDQFVRDSRTAILHWAQEGHAELDWAPPHAEGKLFLTDVRLSTSSDAAVNLWFAADDVRAERSLGTAMQYQAWQVRGTPVLALREGVGQRARRRASHVLAGNGAVVTVSDSLDPLEEQLADLGVPHQ